MIDLDATIRGAVRAELDADRDRLPALVEEAVKRAMAVEPYLPLADILHKSKDAAAAQLRRDAGLRALGVPCGRSLVFKASEVANYLKAVAK